MFVFDRALDACKGAHTHIPETGFIDLEIEFNGALNVPIIALIYSQYDTEVWHRIPGKIDFPSEVSIYY